MGTRTHGCEGRGRWISGARHAMGLLAVASAALLLLVLPAYSTTFSDVPASHSYHGAVTDLAERGIIEGYGDGTFGLRNPVLRQQFAKMIVGTVDLDVSEEDRCPFGDVEVSGPSGLYPDNYVAVVAREGITVGTSVGYFSPYRHITRFQVISMVVRAAERRYPAALEDPPGGYTPTWNPAQSPSHGQNARRAEFSGLLKGLPLADLDPWGAMPRGEVAQVLHNLVQAMGAPPTSTTEPPEPLTEIGDLKSATWRERQGDTVTLEGIFVRDPVPMLVTDLDFVQTNSPVPEPDHVLLVGAVAERMDPSRYGGAILRVTGTVMTDESVGNDVRWVALGDIDFDVVSRNRVYAPGLADIAVEYASDALPGRFAVLFSGGVNSKHNFSRYWNDLKFMYSTLVGPLGFPKENVAVLYADGSAEDNDMPVHYAATEENLAKVFDLLRSRRTAEELIFVFTTNHGGGFNTGAKRIAGGALDRDNDEAPETLWEWNYKIDANGNGSLWDFFSWDESLCAWQGTSTTAPSEIVDDDLQPMFDDLEFDRMVVLMEQCYSGGLIPDIALGGNRVIVSAAGEHEPSYSMSSGVFDEFSYHFTCAIRKSDVDGDPVDADINVDGVVTMLEAFNYARSHDTRPETPWYEDNGDGVPHSGAMPKGGEGMLGASTTLEP